MLDLSLQYPMKLFIISKLCIYRFRNNIHEIFFNSLSSIFYVSQFYQYDKMIMSNVVTTKNFPEGKY